jgi:sulfide:quinone oxidoreductase
MAKILVVGGGFGGIVAAESLAKKLGNGHEITLVSRSNKFVFYPALVRLAFGRATPEDIEFDVREAMADRRITFIQGEIARIHPADKQVTIAHGDLVGDMSYDYLVLALGRRLKTERISGFFEHAHHLLDVESAESFGLAVNDFKGGHVLIGHCPDARLPVPVFETAFALARRLEEEERRDQCTITIVSNEKLDEMFGSVAISESLTNAMETHGIEFVHDFAISRVTPNALFATDGRSMSYDLNMIVPPFGGPGALMGTLLTDREGYVMVDKTMRAIADEYIYAVGDCANFPGPKMGHMAIGQAGVASDNLGARVLGKPCSVTYNHEMMLVIDEGGKESVYVEKDLGAEEPADIYQSRFWGWAKRKQEQYWKARYA